MIYESSLYHHGVEGMHWGVRRYQPYPAGHKGGKEIGEAAKKSRPRRDKLDEDSIKEGKREDAQSYKYNKPNESGWEGAKKAIKAKVDTKEFKTKTAGLAAGMAGSAAATLATSKAIKVLAGAAITKLAPDASPEERKAMVDGLAAIGSLTVYAVSSHYSTKAGKAACEKYLEKKAG